MKDFQIPGSSSTGDSISEELTEYEVHRKLEECRGDLSLRGTSALHTWLPVLQLIIRKFAALEPSLRDACWKMIAQELEGHVRNLAEYDVLQIEQGRRSVLRNSTKAGMVVCYLAVSLANEFESEMVQKSAKKKKGKEDVTYSFSWDRERQSLIKIIINLCSLDLVQLWDPPVISMMEDLSTLLASLCYKFLENPLITREKVLLEDITTLLGLIATKYGLALSVGLKLVQLLRHFEHLVNPVSMIVTAIATKYSSKQIIMDMFREICCTDPSDLIMDSSGTKSFAGFLVATSSQVPAVVLPAIPLLLPHLSGESATFRSGVLGVLGELLKLLHVSSEGVLPSETRDEMLLKLTEHICDINAFVRTKVLHIFMDLYAAQAVPLPLLQQLLDKVVGRLKDKSSLVRKGAIQLLCIMLSSNPFAAQLDKGEFTRKLTAEKQMDKDDLKQSGVMEYLEAAVDFITLITECIPVAVDLLRSKVVSDVLESLEFLCVAKLFQIDGAEEAIKSSFPLVWSQDEQLRDAAVSTFVRLYLTSNDASSSRSEHSKKVVDSLLQICAHSTLGELASLEKLTGLLVSGKQISDLAMKELWAKFQPCSTGSSKSSLLACQLLSMALSITDVSSSVDSIMSGGLLQSSDLLLAKYTCSAINRLIQSEQKARLPESHVLFNQVLALLTSNFLLLDSSQWIPFCEQSLNMVYRLSEEPNQFSEVLLRTLSNLMFKDQDRTNSVAVSRLLFCAGHIAQCQVIHVEVHILNEMKRMKTANQEQSPAAELKGELEEELGLAGSEEQEIELVHKVLEREVGGPGGMLAVFEPLLISVVSNPNKYSCVRLQTTAALALSKFMLVSSEMCDKYLQLFFTILEKSLLPAVRANLIIAVSDLVCRFPNTLEPWTPFVYSRLQDECTFVRKNAIMVLAHLILNDMIKIRGQISAMALCLEDSDSQTVELAKTFFSELSQKGNSLYNVLPDIISQLSDPALEMCSPTSFRRIIKYLFQFIKKDKHHESLVEKLCHRFRAIRATQQAHDLSYCLSLVTPTERGLLKLQEQFSCYQDKIDDTIVFKHLLVYILKAKKASKVDVKVQAEELEKKISEFLQRRHEDEQRVVEGSPVLCDSVST